MHRTQILLHEGQYDALRTRARREDKSLSEVIRLAINQWLGLKTTVRQTKKLNHICGLGKDPGGPSARDHDQFLYE